MLPYFGKDMATLEVERISKLEATYQKASKIILILTILYAIWMGIVILGIYVLKSGHKWALFSLEEWTWFSIGLFSALIILEVIFLLHHFLVKKKVTVQEKPAPGATTFKGKQLHVYTIPPGSKGGLFSKTYIELDHHTILSIRYQLIPPQELWKK